jgi:hypothetical protein
MVSKTNCVALSYQVTQKLMRAKTVEFTTNSPICYIHCCVLVLYSPQFVRAFGQPYSLTSFGLCVGSFERLGNVYGFEGVAYYLGPKNLSPLK